MLIGAEPKLASVWYGRSISSTDVTMVMVSRSLDKWNSVSRDELDQIEAAHGLVGGTGRGRRYATRQMNHAYAVLLSSQFQGYCRDLHSEVVDHLATHVAAQLNIVSDVLRVNLNRDRKLYRGNPNPGNLGSDFGRFNMNFWAEVISDDRRNGGRKQRLENLNAWRNAIAHQDFPTSGPNLQLREVRDWRKACNGLARSFDRVLSNHISLIVGKRPW